MLASVYGFSSGLVPELESTTGQHSFTIASTSQRLEMIFISNEVVDLSIGVAQRK